MVAVGLMDSGFGCSYRTLCRILILSLGLMALALLTVVNNCHLEQHLMAMREEDSASRDILTDLKEAVDRANAGLGELQGSVDRSASRAANLCTQGFESTTESLARLEIQQRTFAEETRLDQEFHSAQERRHCRDRCIIDVNIVHYKNLNWLANNLRSLRRRSQLPSKCVCYNIVTQENTTEEIRQVNDTVRNLGATVERYNVGSDAVGSSKLNDILSELARRPSRHGSLVTVIADSDTLMFYDGWDSKISDMFIEDDDLVLAGINPRCSAIGWTSGVYEGRVEWNWMALRSSFFEERFDFNSLVKTHPDWESKGEQGYLFTRFATDQNKKYHVWPGHLIPVPNKTAIVTADPFTKDLFVLHSFWSRAKYSLHPTDIKGVADLAKKGMLLTDKEVQDLFDWSASYPVVRRPSFENR
jgi:hypothetical protein